MPSISAIVTVLPGATSLVSATRLACTLGTLSIWAEAGRPAKSAARKTHIGSAARVMAAAIAASAARRQPGRSEDLSTREGVKAGLGFGSLIFPAEERNAHYRRHARRTLAY